MNSPGASRYSDPAFSHEVANRLLAIGLADPAFTKLRTGQMQSDGGSLDGYIRYCGNPPVPTFTEDGAHARLARRMEFVVEGYARLGEAPGERSAVLGRLVDEALIAFPLVPR